MNVVLIYAVVCFVISVYGRHITTEKPFNVDIYANQTFKACGSDLQEVFKAVCYLDKNATANLIKILNRSKRGVVDDCCHKFCSLKDFTDYCPVKPPHRLVLENELRAVTPPPRISSSTHRPRRKANEVRKNGKLKAHRDGRWRRQPIVMPCMYRSFAHFLLRERRRLQGKIHKKERTMSNAQHGTTGPVRICETCSDPQYQT